MSVYCSTTLSSDPLFKENVMKRVCLSVISCLLLVLLIAPVSAGQNVNPPAQQGERTVANPVQEGGSDQLAPKSHTMAWREKIMMQNEIRNRASQRRASEMRKAAIERDAQSNDPVNETQQVVK